MRGATSLVERLGVFAGALLLAAPLAWAADANPTGAAESTLTDASREQILRTIEETRQTDPELAGVMAEQLRELDSGNLQMRDLVGPSGSERDGASGAPPSPGEVPGGGLALGSGAATGAGSGGYPAGGEGTGGRGEYLPAEVRGQLEKLFQEKGTGDPSKDGAVRQEAERILKENGIDPREMGQGREWNHEGGTGTEQGREGGWRDANNDNLDDDSGSVLDGIGRGGYEATSPRDAFEQWERSEAGQQVDAATREQYREMSERYQADFQHGDGESERAGESGERPGEGMSHEVQEVERVTNERSSEAPAREYEAPTREYEASAREYEAPTREFEAATREYESPTHEYEAPTHEYEAPSRESETPTREFEAPTHEFEGPMHEYETPTGEYQAPQGPQQ